MILKIKYTNLLYDIQKQRPEYNVLAQTGLYTTSSNSLYNLRGSNLIYTPASIFFNKDNGSHVETNQDLVRLR